ncbi:MAG TPA: HAMP domain-containing sensor histidine kinase, partial [Saprospiraceae bacterium]|nr:HAMP domain-containing sensor histidine kinase [Saprospiraceae bacterium]
IVGLSVIIFTVIGIMTTIYLNRMSAQESAQKSRVSTDLLIKYINEEIGNNEDPNSIRNYLTEQTNRFSELFEGYIDLFNEEGYNIKSSRSNDKYIPNLPKKEIIKMQSYLEKLNQGKFASYQATDKYNIIEIKNSQNTQTLYLGYSPAILRLGNTDKEYVKTYIGTMLNVYIFLFLLATAIAIAISNTVTNPLTILKNNLRTYKFGKTHPKLEWSNNDEIGELINEYNLLTDEITKSADLLAKTEREMAWREMAKQVAHEIKNPLTPMKLSLQYLERSIKEDPERAKVLIPKISTTLMEQINNLTQIADSFSNFATLPKTTNEKIILNEVVESIHDLFRKREDMDIEMLEPVNDIYVLADRNHLVRILNNVVKNATQAIAEDTRGKIEIELTKKENKAVIRVSDNGTGIPDEMKPKVFTPNFTSKSSGTGLGLAICANMLESMNGSIYFESEVGIGTHFFIELPLLKDDFMEGDQDIVLLE